MPSIFEQLTDTNRASQELKPTGVSFRGKAQLARLSKRLVAKRNLVSATLLLLLLAWLWLSEKPIETNNTSSQQTQVLTLPNNDKSNTVPLYLTTNEKSAPDSAFTSEVIKQKLHNSTGQISGLVNANQKAIELAISGQASQATTILEQALLNDPQAGMVFENLRRLYAGFASQSYQLALEPSKPKPIMVELANADKKIEVQLDTPGRILVDTKTTTVQMKPTTTASAVAKNSPAVSVTEPVPAQEVASIETPPTSTPVIKVTTLVVTEPTAAQKEAAQRKANLQALQQALKHWSDAWSKQDVKGYFASYAPTYSPKSTTRKAWMDYRQERILAPKRIKVELSDVKIVLIKPNLARISFTQSYTSDTLSARDQKSLELELINQSWLIINESGR